MKFFILPFTLFIFFSCNIQAQLNIDSLQNVIAGSKTYKEKLNAYTEYVLWLQTKNFDSTIEVCDEGIRFARENADSITVAVFKHYKGVANYFKGKYDVAAKLYYEAISILEYTKEKKKLALVYNELAKLYRKTRDLDHSLQHYTRAIALFRSINDKPGVAMILNESGVVFEYKQDYEEAIRRYTASLKIDEALKDSVGIAYALSNIAGVYLIQKKFDAAESTLVKTLAIRKRLKDNFAIALSYSDLGAVYSAKGNFTKATAVLDSSNMIAAAMGYPELQTNNYNELSSVAQKQGNFQAAFEYLQKRTALRDSIFSTEKTKQVEELNARYETIKKEQKIDQQHHRLRLQNFLFVGIAGLILLAGLLIHSQYKRYRLIQDAKLKTEMLKQQELATKAVIEAEENERQRIAKDLHDGVGQMMSAAKMNLSAFESEINFRNNEQRISYDKIIKLVDDGCKEVRHVSHNMMPNALLKNNLADAVRDFVDKLDNKKMKVHLYAEGLEQRLDANTEIVLYRVIQECVNNVIKHADASTLDISIIRDKDGISAMVEDNGRGFDSTDQHQFEGIGLKNISTRIEYLKGKVDFDSAPGRGTVVALHVPLG